MHRCRAREERAKAKARREADDHWRQLLRLLLSRVRVHQSYGSSDLQQLGRGCGAIPTAAAAGTAATAAASSSAAVGVSDALGNKGTQSGGSPAEAICINLQQDGAEHAAQQPPSCDPPGLCISALGGVETHCTGSAGPAEGGAGGKVAPQQRKPPQRGRSDGKPSRAANKKRGRGGVTAAAVEDCAAGAELDEVNDEHGHGSFKQRRMAGMLVDVEQI